jgi:hypothetical protein
MFDPAALGAARASQSAQRRVAEVGLIATHLLCFLAGASHVKTFYSHFADISKLCK